MQVNTLINNLTKNDNIFYQFSPHRYIVKPYRGQIVGNGTAAVNVTLLPFHYNNNDKFNDKFLLQVSSSANFTKITKLYSGFEVLAPKNACV